MAVSHSDKHFLASDATFQNRVRMALVGTAVAVATEGDTASFHSRRRPFAIAIMNAPDDYKLRFTTAVATDTTVIDAATGNGATVIDAANAAARQALVTDVQINNAISARFNTFCALHG